MGQSDLSQSVGAASYLADLQPACQPGAMMGVQASSCDPGSSSQQKISQEDLKVMRDKFPMLNDFSEHFLQSRTLDELLPAFATQRGQGRQKSALPRTSQTCQPSSTR
jgi:hypothetical protein